MTSIKNSKAFLIGGSLQDASILSGKEFVVVQELFQTATTDHADVVFPAASFAEVDGTFTNNAGNVQRVRKAIDPTHQSKPDWMITSLIAKRNGNADRGGTVGIGNFSLDRRRCTRLRRAPLPDAQGRIESGPGKVRGLG